ncbi:sulfotransferase family protein [Mycobacterium xenopi 3993]|nr:sulfotransferase family protein [Mycobacterium xenopi 3993]
MTGRTDVGTVEDLHESATKVTGLDDFGSDEDNYREALTVLLDSYRREADLTPLGSKMNRFFLRGALVARLLSEAAWKQYPEHADVVIERPIFVTGLVRTGTTALHRLLGADPAHQGLQMWLAEYPQPRPPARPGNQIRCIASSTPSTPATTRRTPATPGCTSWPLPSSRNAGSCCDSRFIRCRTKRWPTCPAMRSGWQSRTGRRHIGGTAKTFS